MAVIKAEVRSGAYYDSIVLMQLQRALTEQPGILDAGVVMGTNANKEVLAQSSLLVAEAEAAGNDDLIIVVRATDATSAQAALAKVDELVAARRGRAGDQEYQPRSLETAAKMLPEAQWVLVSVPGRYAAGVARQALRLNKHVFLYSDNVSLEDEVALKHEAAQKGLLVMGPDCGTAIVNGIGLGFANKVRQGPIGVVAASGTGLQQVTVRIHQMGGGITHALGTGGRDLSEAVNAATARQGLDLMARDPDAKVIVLVSKPPSSKIADTLVQAARSVGKPVVVNFIGYPSASRRVDNVFFATTFDETAELAIRLIDSPEDFAAQPDPSKFAPGQRYLRGLFSGGTLQYEALLILQNYVPVVYSNAPLDKKNKLEDSLVSKAHTVIDLGEDEFTVGRLHPMLDNDLRIRRLEKEASDPEVAVILLDVVLGYGAHGDPASELAPAIAAAIKSAKDADRHLEVVAIVCGTDGDPQGMEGQIRMLKDSGAKIETSNDAAARHVGRLLQTIERRIEPKTDPTMKPVDLQALKNPLAGINVGLESFADSLRDQGAQAVHVDWKPVAGSSERLVSILERMRQAQ
ncbi:MAG: acyl-CoA synthetase FdrA [Anaerolineales bacterium]|nr:acyl-CoA synthetase FdrA [Anaerolineales bacterium]